MVFGLASTTDEKPPSQYLPRPTNATDCLAVAFSFVLRILYKL